MAITVAALFLVLAWRAGWLADAPLPYILAAFLGAHLAIAVRNQGRAEQAVRASEERFRSLVQRSADLVAIVAEDGLITYVSPASVSMLGYEPEEILGKTGVVIMHPEDVALGLRIFNEVRGSPGQARSGELRFVARDGRPRWVEFTATNMLADENIRGIVANARDVTERRLIEQKIMEQTSRDPLTGLANRTFFVERIGAAARHMAVTSTKAAALVVDLDRFDLVNDTAGHEVGDQLLLAVAERLEACVRPGDLTARLGSDEFALLLGNVLGGDDALSVASRVVAAIRRPFVLAGRELFLTCSVGIALCQAESDPNTLLRDAHLAMHAAKNRGGGGYELFDASLCGLARRRMDLEAELRRGIERGEFVVHYQPIVDLRLDTVTGFEALVRWDRDDGGDRGLVLPGEFIPIAERTGAIDRLGSWVLEEACGKAQEWRTSSERRALDLHVNLSARQLLDPALPQKVMRVLTSTGLDPVALVLEITETVFMQDAETSLAAIGRLREYGVRFAIDDFGSGYSSFAYLRRLPVEVLKLDHVLIDGLADGLDDSAVVETVITLAHRMGMTAVAEGVETPLQRETLRALGCDQFQGFCFGPAVAPEDALALLRLV